jgi:hypothetical protein
MQPANMPPVRHLIALTSLVTLLQSVTCSAGSDSSPDHDHSEPASGNSFYELLQYTHATPVSKSLGDLVAESSAIAVEHFQTSRKGEP